MLLIFTVLLDSERSGKVVPRLIIQELPASINLYSTFHVLLSSSVTGPDHSLLRGRRHGIIQFKFTCPCGFLFIGRVPVGR
ncbi:hypothetical protein QGX15_gp136 [Pseudomonas phage psageK4e]|uniref:Uncharacterized protein n=1 Tax=Pseudomonas phage psageK4e TaxID=2875723 RepID=A0AAE8XMG1_9CAUD|nr:hypothetical protein QGX15_gp136 [Pseudomonas phage psageK4e]UAW53559.1 hypothetical protein psageK4e_111c [Pseudomonas phage psageK4e]